MTKITEGSWEAEKGVVAIHPKRHPDALIIYEPSSIGSLNPIQTAADWKAELEANARAMAAVPEMIALLEECADELGAVGLPTLSGECYELLKRISGEENSL